MIMQSLFIMTKGTLKNMFMEDLFFMIVIQLLRDGYQFFMDMPWISVGYGSDIEGVVTP